MRMGFLQGQGMLLELVLSWGGYFPGGKQQQINGAKQIRKQEPVGLRILQCQDGKD